MTKKHARRKWLGRRVGTYHCWNRCVRRSFLCGKDPLTGRDFSHRRHWMLKRQEQLAKLFAIDVGFHAEMSNHFHLVLRTRPDVARRWSREEVARRWLTITRLAKCMSDALPQPSTEKMEQLLKNKKRVAKARRRLSSVSWFMAILSENIARRANAEDKCRGRFWNYPLQCTPILGLTKWCLASIWLAFDLSLAFISGIQGGSPKCFRGTLASLASLATC
jgi:hypothetical protein